MKTLNIYAALIFSIFTTNLSFAQSSVTKESIKVSGNCGMCKRTIEKSAKSAGATSADWNMETKVLSVSYNSSNVNSEKIQKAIATSGYDTQNFQADDKAYNNLHGCCKYQRETSSTSVNRETKTQCKNPEACKDKACYKDGSCDESMCKDMPECKSACCSKS